MSSSATASAGAGSEGRRREAPGSRDRVDPRRNRASRSGPGGAWRQQLRLPAGHAALHAFAPRLPGASALPPFGTLWLDPQQAALQFLVGAPGEERVLLQTPIPNLATLRGTEWTVQALVLPPAGTPWLTDPSSLLLP